MSSKRALEILRACRNPKPYRRTSKEIQRAGLNKTVPTRRNLDFTFFNNETPPAVANQEAEEDVDDVMPSVSPSPPPVIVVMDSNERERSENTPPAGSAKRVRPSAKKRVLQPKNHQREMAKRALNAGEEHTTPEGVHRNARKIKPACKTTCNRCYKRRLTEDERKEIFSRFWNLDSADRKRDYLSRSIRSQTPKTCNTLPERAKKATRTYYFIVENEEVRVCKSTFLRTLDICDKWIETTMKKLEGGNGLQPDLRGKHCNRPHRWGRMIIDQVKSHIESFPRVYSHYTRENTKREYLETGLSIERMYRMYVKKAKEMDWKRFASSRLYRRIFNENYNLGFFLPKKDQCELCNRWKQAKDVSERRAMVQEYDEHLRHKKVLRTLKEKDRKSAGQKKCVACFDLQKVLICPRSETSLFFYRNKISIFNFTIFDIAPKIGHCFVWNETEAKKGSNEIGTCVFNFIEEKVKEGYTDFVFYSDSPTGQNRNRMIFSMYLLASAKFGVNITHRYLESGHSYSEADSMHARIEIEARKKSIFSQDEWVSHIANAKIEGEPYRVNLVRNEDVKDLKYLVNQQCWDRDTKGRVMRWTEIREISCRAHEPNKLYYKYKLFEKSPKVFAVKMKTKVPEVNLSTYIFPRAYDKKFPLSAEKIADLQWLCKKQAIPTAYHSFYENLYTIQ